MNKLTYLSSLRNKNERIIILKFLSRMNWCNTKSVSFHPSIWSVVIPITTEYSTPQSNHTRILNIQIFFYVTVVHIVTGWRPNTSVINCPRMAFFVNAYPKYNILDMIWPHSLVPAQICISNHRTFTSGQTFSHL